MKLAVQERKPFFSVQGMGLYAQGFEVGQDIRFDTFQPELCRAKIVRLDPDGDVLSLYKAVVALLELAFQHVSVFAADVVVLIAPGGDIDALFKVLHIGPLVDKGKLHMDRGIKIIQKVAVAFKNLRLVLGLRKLIVDVKKLDRLCVGAAVCSADPIPVHFPVGDTLLYRLRGGPKEPRKKAALLGRLSAGRRSVTTVFSRFGAELF